MGNEDTKFDIDDGKLVMLEFIQDGPPLLSITLKLYIQLFL